MQARIGTIRARLHPGYATPRTDLTERELRGDLITAETTELSRIYDADTISAATFRRLQRNLGLETAPAREGHQ